MTHRAEACRLPDPTAFAAAGSTQTWTCPSCHRLWCLAPHGREWVWENYAPAQAVLDGDMVRW